MHTIYRPSPSVSLPRNGYGVRHFLHTACGVTHLCRLNPRQALPAGSNNLTPTPRSSLHRRLATRAKSLQRKVAASNQKQRGELSSIAKLYSLFADAERLTLFRALGTPKADEHNNTESIHHQVVYTVGSHSDNNYRHLTFFITDDVVSKITSAQP